MKKNTNNTGNNWSDFIETAEFKDEVAELAESDMSEVESALESAMDEVGNYIMSELSSNHEDELGDPYDHDDGEGGREIRTAVEEIAANVLHNWLKKRNF